MTNKVAPELQTCEHVQSADPTGASIRSAGSPKVSQFEGQPTCSRGETCDPAGILRKGGKYEVDVMTAVLTLPVSGALPLLMVVVSVFG